MKKLLRFLVFVLMVGGAYAQSKLPACQGTDESRWTNCFGTATYTKDKKYPGEFKVDDQSQYVGEWKDGNMHGNGVLHFSPADKWYSFIWHLEGWKVFRVDIFELLICIESKINSCKHRQDQRLQV